MFYDNVEKLEKIEKTACENLMVASVSSKTTEKELQQIAHNYRADMALMVGVLREYKELVVKLQDGDSNGT
jgi:uncharacterized protein YpbB